MLKYNIGITHDYCNTTEPRFLEVFTLETSVVSVSLTRSPCDQKSIQVKARFSRFLAYMFIRISVCENEV